MLNVSYFHKAQFIVQVAPNLIFKFTRFHHRSFPHLFLGFFYKDNVTGTYFAMFQLSGYIVEMIVKYIVQQQHVDDFALKGDGVSCNNVIFFWLH